jgi:hypothetical protein
MRERPHPKSLSTGEGLDSPSPLEKGWDEVKLKIDE